jgi:hypothetical protein
VYEFGKDMACFLYPTPNARTSKASQAFWQVDDVDKEIVELKAGGVAIENYDMPGDKSPSGAISATAPKPPGSRTPKATHWRCSRSQMMSG